MKRRTSMPKPTKPIARTARVKPVNRERRSAEWRRAYESEDRVQWIQGQPSVISGDGPCDNVHIRGDGASRKAGAEWIIPMTRAEHDELHHIGLASFEQKYGISLYLAAKYIQRKWEAHLKASTPDQLER